MCLETLQRKNGINADGIVIIQLVGEGGRYKTLLKVNAGIRRAKEMLAVIGIHAAITIDGQPEGQIGRNRMFIANFGNKEVLNSVAFILIGTE